jgi:hypothetical protein
MDWTGHMNDLCLACRDRPEKQGNFTLAASGWLCVDFLRVMPRKAGQNDGIVSATPLMAVSDRNMKQ